MKRPPQHISWPVSDENGKWARNKEEQAEAFANHVPAVFQLNTSENPEMNKKL